MHAGKGLPDVSSVLKHFKDAFDWTEADRSGRVIPHEGGDIEYDTACATIREIESHLKSYLKEQCILLGDAPVNLFYLRMLYKFGYTVALLSYLILTIFYFILVCRSLMSMLGKICISSKYLKA